MSLMSLECRIASNSRAVLTLADHRSIGIAEDRTLVWPALVAAQAKTRAPEGGGRMDSDDSPSHRSSRNWLRQGHNPIRLALHDGARPCDTLRQIPSGLSEAAC